MMQLDHVAIAATDLAEGTALVEAALGLSMGPGGAHPLMATHNRLLGLGDSYLEVIAPDPAALRPPFPRWFDLDRFEGRPRPSNWILRCADLDAALALLPEAGRPLELRRGDLRWRMAVPEDGRLPFDNLFPALIEWQGSPPSLPDAGLRLARIEIRHPEAPALARRLAPHLSDDRVAFLADELPALRFTLNGPQGPRLLA
ncbi:VOC family protein [Rhodobacter sphaeroides]|uniref:VOC family protein n=1 Tax=Cereibacter sphaeroides TaxID=1063 RepID=UPI0013298E9F|nr:VOC family protein [Cereibacter sphaeroides]MWP36185.1 VOC family protein [Cereibacter sphaeroides]